MMRIAESMLPEFDHEFALTRKALERVPEDKFDYKPHEKSMSMGVLAAHLAESPGWGVMIAEQDSFDVAPKDGPKWEPFAPKTKEEVLAKFDESTEATRKALASCSDESMMQPWSLLVSGKAEFTMPRVAVLRSMVFNHNVHHRAQLGVYLRLNDIPVPSTYGPSADEGAS